MKAGDRVRLSSVHTATVNIVQLDRALVRVDTKEIPPALSRWQVHPIKFLPITNDDSSRETAEL